MVAIFLKSQDSRGRDRWISVSSGQSRLDNRVSVPSIIDFSTYASKTDQAKLKRLGLLGKAFLCDLSSPPEVRQGKEAGLEEGGSLNTLQLRSFCKGRV